jgi:chemotaxis response regulator CheB
MPRMDGFTFLRLLMARQPTPVIVVSGNSARENVFRALELGALDFIAKPTRTIASDLSVIEADLAAKVSMVRQLTPAGRDVKRRIARGTSAQSIFAGAAEKMQAPAPVAEKDAALSRLVVIGASTGGPSALVEVFSQFRAGASRRWSSRSTCQSASRVRSRSDSTSWAASRWPRRVTSSRCTRAAPCCVRAASAWRW